CVTGRRENAREHAIMLSDVLKFGIGKKTADAIVKADCTALLVGIGEQYELLRMIHRQPVQQNRIDHGENRSVCADAESEREHSNCGESWGLSQRAERIANIL